MLTKINRIWSLSVKEFIHLINDWWMPAFMIVGGAMELLAIGWATSRPITNLPLAVIDQDKSAASRAFIIALENTGTFSLGEQASDIAEIEDKFERGKLYAAVIIPPNYAEQVTSPSGKPTLQVLLNGAESMPAMEALRAIEGVARDQGERILLTRLGLSASDFAGFNPSLRVWFNEELSEKFYTTPAELALMMEFTVLLVAALAFSRERELGTLEQLLVMPYSSLEIIVGKSIPVIIIGYVDFLLMLSVVHFAFHVPIRGSLGLLLLLAFAYIFVALAIGLVISVLSRNQHQAFLLVFLIGFTGFMFTGYAAPVESMNPVMQFIANFVPSHHWLAILRGILLKGAGIDVLWSHLLMLSILGLVIISFSLVFVRRALEWE
jgi:ABC-2 type transport system permease protein